MSVEIESETNRAAGAYLTINDQKSRIGDSLAGYLLVAGAATMWGTIGIFFTILHNYFGLSALAIGFMRASIAAALLVTVLAIFRPMLLRASPRALALYAGFGCFGIGLFYIFNTEAVILTNVATASVLLYTAPAFVTLFAWRRWGEAITGRKMIALALALLGCALVAKAYDPAQLQLNLAGVLVGALAGFAYALFTLFAKTASPEPPWTTVAYSLIFGALFLLPLQFIPLPGLSGEGVMALFQNRAAWIFMLGLCLGPTLGSYALYNAAMRRVPASNASLVATIEPVVASFAGFFVFGQVLEPLQIVGAVMIVGAAVLLTARVGAKYLPGILG
jgi:DME family drug/metabolite transporter